MFNFKYMEKVKKYLRADNPYDKLLSLKMIFHKKYKINGRH